MVYLLSKYGQLVPFIMVFSPKFTPSPYLVFLQERSLNISRQTDTSTQWLPLILLDIGIFQTRSKACREEPSLNYGLRNIRHLLLSPPSPCVCSYISFKLFEIQHGTEQKAMLNFSGSLCCYSAERPLFTLDKMHCKS